VAGADVGLDQANAQATSSFMRATFSCISGQLTEVLERAAPLLMAQQTLLSMLGQPFGGLRVSLTGCPANVMLATRLHNPNQLLITDPIQSEKGVWEGS
jgi:hypothetical protein